MTPNLAPLYKIFNVTNVHSSYYLDNLQDDDFLRIGLAVVLRAINLQKNPG